MHSSCLIIPPSLFLLDERVFITLGILRVAAMLEKRGYPVEVLDLSGIKNYKEVVKIYAESSGINTFCLTATTPQMPSVSLITEVIREVKPRAKIILGGPHITLINAAYRNEMKRGVDGRAAAAMKIYTSMFDVLVAGDGEYAIFPALEPGAPKLINADDPGSALFLTKKQLDELPYPARHLVDVGSYHYSIEGVPATSMIAQLGCPFNCGFCGGRESPMLRRVRMRSSANVVAEMVHLYKTYGFKGFMLYDDELNVNPRMIELMNLVADCQKELGVEFKLRGFVKSELFTDEQAEAMYRAGFRWILAGFESGSPKILNNINKKAFREENTRCVEIARRNGLKVKALMSMGHPGESEETVRHTHDWLMQVKPDDFDVTVITTYPGTPYYDYAVQDEKNRDVWVYSCDGSKDRLYSYEVDYTKVADYYKGAPDGGYRSYVYTDYLSPEKIVQLRDNLENDVRRKLNIPFNPTGTLIRYEHSMGQSGVVLPPNILRTSGGKT